MGEIPLEVLQASGTCGGRVALGVDADHTQRMKFSVQNKMANDSQRQDIHEWIQPW